MNFQVSTSSLQILSWGQARVCEWRHATWKLYHSIHLCNPLWHYSFWKLGSTQLVGRWLCQISLLQVGTVSIRSRALINSCNVISVFLEKYWDISNLVFFWDFIEKMDLTHFAFCTQPPTNWVNRTQLISLAVNLVFFFFSIYHICAYLHKLKLITMGPYKNNAHTIILLPRTPPYEETQNPF